MRNIYVSRRAIKALTAKGEKYKSISAEYKRKDQLERGAVTVRRGEKIIGQVNSFQSVVNMGTGRFLTAQTNLDHFRKMAAMGGTYNASVQYFLNQASREISSQQWTTKTKGNQARG